MTGSWIVQEQESVEYQASDTMRTFHPAITCGLAGTTQNKAFLLLRIYHIFPSYLSQGKYREKWEYNVTKQRSDRVLSLVKSQGTSVILQKHFCSFCLVILTSVLLYSGHLNVPKLCTKGFYYAEKNSRWIYYTFCHLTFQFHILENFKEKTYGHF